MCTLRTHRPHMHFLMHLRLYVMTWCQKSFSFSPRHLGILRCFRSPSSANHPRAELVSGSVSSSSHSKPAVHISCSNIFAVIVKGTNSPIGANSVAIFFRKFRFVYTMVSYEAFSLNVNTSSWANHQAPSGLAHGNWSQSKFTSAFRSCRGIRASNLDEIDSHLRACMPASDNRMYSSIPWSSVWVHCRPCKLTVELFPLPQESHSSVL